MIIPSPRERARVRGNEANSKQLLTYLQRENLMGLTGTKYMTDWSCVFCVEDFWRFD
jgi:hypothetical protein